MENRVPARLTAAQGRKFGVTVGLAFVAIGLVLLWRDKTTRATVLLSIGSLFVLSGLIIPTLLGPVERAWMGLAHLLSRFTTPIFMGVVYFVVMTPIGLIRRFTSGSPVLAKSQPGSRWVTHTPTPPVRENMERQF